MKYLYHLDTPVTGLEVRMPITSLAKEVADVIKGKNDKIEWVYVHSNIFYTFYTFKAKGQKRVYNRIDVELKEEPIPSLVGSLYIPQDNTYQFNTSNKHARYIPLAGTTRPYNAPIVTTILQDPFDMVIISGVNFKQVTHKMVVVESNKVSYLTMFHKGGVIENTLHMGRMLHEHRERGIRDSMKY